MTQIPSTYRGRFAPTPSGPLHFGSLVTALASWLDARAQSGIWLVRIDDLDPPREVPGAADTILRQLAAHGLHWDSAVRYQSRRQEAYASAVARLLDQGDAFYCRLSRSELEALGQRHPGPAVAVNDPQAAVRLAVPDHLTTFHDRFCGRCRFDLRQEGAFVIRRRDGLYAYQLACAVDDSDDGITDVVRGADLLDSTARQLLVLERLGKTPPSYGHLPLVRDGLGRKLAKSAGSAAIDARHSADNLRRAMAWLGGPAVEGNVEAVLAEGLAWWKSEARGRRRSE